DAGQLDILIRDIQADSKRMQLLHILGHQLELLINEGRPGLQSLFTTLKVEALVSEEEDRDLRANFSLKAVRYPYTIRRARPDSDVSVLGGDTYRLLEYRY